MAQQGWDCAVLGLCRPPAGRCRKWADKLRVQDAEEGKAGEMAKNDAVRGTEPSLELDHPDLAVWTGSQEMEEAEGAV